jgi:hypothetical protein
VFKPVIGNAMILPPDRVRSVPIVASHARGSINAEEKVHWVRPLRLPRQGIG